MTRSPSARARLAALLLVALASPGGRAAASPEVETAVFAVGWFWAADSRFGSLDGVVATRTGYAGGSLPDPTYHRIGDHVEAVEVTFDPRRISYDELLAAFWGSHPAGLEPGAATRVAAAILTRGPEQRRAAEASRRRAAAALGEEVHARVAPAGRFWPAEPLHQKFTLRRLAPRLVAEETARDPGFLGGTAAARLNGWLQGFGGEAALAAAARELATTPEELARRLDAERAGGP